MLTFHILGSDELERPGLFTFIFSIILQNLIISFLWYSLTQSPEKYMELMVFFLICLGISFSLSFLLTISCKKTESKLYGTQISWNACMVCFYDSVDLVKNGHSASFCWHLSLMLAGTKLAESASSSTASTMPLILMEISISKEAEVTSGIISMRGSVPFVLDAAGSIFLLSGISDSEFDGEMNNLGKDFKSAWSSWTALFIFRTKSWILDDFFMLLIVTASSFMTLEELELTFKELLQICFFIYSGACWYKMVRTRDLYSNMIKMIGRGKFNNLNPILTRTLAVWSRSLGYLIFWTDAAIESFYAISTAAHGCPNFDVLLPWVLKVEAAMGWLPSSKIGL